MSTLSRQLEQHRLAAPTPSIKLNNAKNKKISLMYTEGEAADFDARTVYHLGLNGLQELVDAGASELAEFREALFSQSVAETERHLQGNDFNENLNNALNLFLSALSPYFLQKPAHKILEYFVRHFQIYSHNSEQLLSCALPFHDSPFFVRVVCLPIELKDTKWAFLQNIRKSKEPLSRPQLVKACMSEFGILKVVSDLVANQPKNEKLPSFFAVLASEVILKASYGKRHGNKDQHILTDKVLPLLVPAALDAIRDKRRAERQRAGYVIAAQLAKHSELSDKATKLFLLSAIRKASQETLSGALQCSSIVLFYGPKTETLPAKSVERLVSKFDHTDVANALQEALSEFPSSATAARFLGDLYLQLANACTLESFSLLKACVLSCFPPDATALFSSLAEIYKKTDTPDNVKECAQQIARHLASVRPSAIDKALNENGSKANFAFASSCFSGEVESAVSSKPVEMDGVRTTLRLALLHVQPSVRAHALTEFYNSKPTWSTLGFGILLDRITDDSAQVSEAALKLTRVLLSSETENLEDANGLSKKRMVKLLDAFKDAAARFGSSSSFQVALSEAVQCIKFQKQIDPTLLSDLLLIPLQNILQRSTSVKGKPVDGFEAASAAAWSCFCHLLANNRSDFVDLGNFESNGGMIAFIDLLTNSESARVAAVNLLEYSLASENPGSTVTLACALASCLAPSKKKKTRTSHNKEVILAAVRACTGSLVWRGYNSESGTTLSLSKKEIACRRKLITEAMDTLIEQVMNENDKTTSKTLYASDVPLSFDVLGFVLGSPDAEGKVEVSSCFASSLETIMSKFFEGTLLSSLLLIASGAFASVAPNAEKKALILATALISASSELRPSKLSFLEVTPFLVHSLGNVKDKGARIAALDCVDACLSASLYAKDSFLDFKSVNKSAIETLPDGTQKPRISGEAFTVLLKRIAQNRSELETEGSSMDRILRTFTGDGSADCVAALFERAAQFLSVVNAENVTNSPVLRFVEKLVQPIAALVPLDILNDSACGVARMAVEKNLDTLLQSISSRWIEPGATVDVSVILSALEKGQASRAVALQSLQMQHVFEQLSEDDRNTCFDILCSIVSGSRKDQSNLSEDAIQAFRVIPFTGTLLRKRLEKKSLPVKDRMIILEAARARVFHSGDIVAKSDTEVCIHLLPPLFKFLEDGQIDLVLLVTLNRCVSLLLQFIKAKEVKPSSKDLAASLTRVNMDAVVKCILLADNAPLRNVALELLSSCTFLFPGKAMEVVLPILKSFSEGENPEDDTQRPEVSPYTFVMLEHLTKCFTSTWVDTGKTETATESQLVNVISLFIDASSRSSLIQRQLNLYEMLVHSLSPGNSSLWCVVVVLLMNGVMSSDDSNNVEQQLMLVQELCLRFSVSDQVFVMMQIVRSLHRFMPLAHLEHLEMEVEGPGMTEFQLSLVESLKDLTDSVLSENAKFAFTSSLCRFLSEHLSSKPFMRALRGMSFNASQKVNLQGSEGFLGLLHHLHQQIHRTTTEEEAELESKPLSNEKLREWSKTRDDLCNVLDKISALLSVPLFVGVLKELLQDENAHVRHLAIRQLSAKVSQQHQRWRPEETLVFLEMVSQLHEIIVNVDESQVNKQTALLSIDVLARNLGKEHPAPFVPVFSSVVSELREANKTVKSGMKDDSETFYGDVQLASSACLCIGTMLEILGQKSLPLLPKFAKELLFGFKQFVEFSSNHDQELEDEDDTMVTSNEADARLTLAQSAASSVFSLVAQMPEFLSPYLDDLLLLVGAGEKNSVPALIRATSTRVGERIAEKIDPRLLLTPLMARFSDFVAKGEFEAAERMVLMLHTCVEQMNREAIVKHLPTLTKFFVLGLDTRFLANEVCTDLEVLESREGNIEELEEAFVECYLTMALQLSGPQMKQTYSALCDAVRSVNVKETPGTSSTDLFGGIQDSASSSRKRKSEESEDEEEEAKDSDSVLDLSGGLNWKRQCRANTLYLMSRRVGEKLQSLASPFLIPVVYEAVQDLQMEIGGQEPGENSSDDEGSDSESSAAASEQEVSTTRPKKKIRVESGAAVSATVSSSVGDQTAKFRLQQRSLRERGVDMLAVFCDFSRDALLDKGLQPSSLFNSILDGLMATLDIDTHRLSSSLKDEAEYYGSFVEEHLRPCLVKLASTASEESTWQVLHRAILQFGKHESPEVRIETIQTLVALFEEVGESYIVLLAETLPTIAELLEDSDKSVKQVAHKAAKKLQQLSGEDLTTFFS